MSLTYAIADLHGRFDLLTAAFDAIVKHAAERSFKITTSAITSTVARRAARSSII